jgi:hypothetical protein
MSVEERQKRARVAIDRLRNDGRWMRLDYPIEPFQGRDRKRLPARVEDALALPTVELDDAARIALANGLVRIDRPAEAIPFLDTAVATHPQDVTLRHNRGAALLRAERFAPPGTATFWNPPWQHRSYRPKERCADSGGCLRHKFRLAADPREPALRPV